MVASTFLTLPRVLLLKNEVLSCADVIKVNMYQHSQTMPCVIIKPSVCVCVCLLILQWVGTDGREITPFNFDSLTYTGPTKCKLII